MKHPTPEQLKTLLSAVDTACWCLAVKENTKPGRKISVDWKEALNELREAWGIYQLATSEGVAIESEAKP